MSTAEERTAERARASLERAINIARVAGDYGLAECLRQRRAKLAEQRGDLQDRLEREAGQGEALVVDSCDDADPALNGEWDEEGHHDAA